MFEPVEDEPLGRAPRVPALLELILKDTARLHALIREAVRPAELLPRFLAVALAGFVFYGVAMALVLNAAGVWPHLTPVIERLAAGSGPLIAFVPDATGLRRWFDGSALALTAAYALGLVAATGICLPSLYFYGLLSGVRMSMIDVTLHALKGEATAAVALVGILPIYAAAAMGLVVFHAPPPLLHAALWGGLILPFVAGLWGTRSLYVGFGGLCDTLPPDRRDRRACFLRRLVLSWSAIYTAVTPVMIYTLWQALSR